MLVLDDHDCDNIGDLGSLLVFLFGLQIMLRGNSKRSKREAVSHKQKPEGKGLNDIQVLPPS